MATNADRLVAELSLLPYDWKHGLIYLANCWMVKVPKKSFGRIDYETLIYKLALYAYSEDFKDEQS